MIGHAPGETVKGGRGKGGNASPPGDSRDVESVPTCSASKVGSLSHRSWYMSACRYLLVEPSGRGHCLCPIPRDGEDHKSQHRDNLACKGGSHSNTPQLTTHMQNNDFNVTSSVERPRQTFSQPVTGSTSTAQLTPRGRTQLMRVGRGREGKGGG
eukprot:scaffold20806_cov107-Isochrysis_galbana.AAC.2